MCLHIKIINICLSLNKKNVVTEKAEQLSTFHVFIWNKNLNMSVNVEKILILGKKKQCDKL